MKKFLLAACAAIVLPGIANAAPFPSLADIPNANETFAFSGGSYDINLSGTIAKQCIAVSFLGAADNAPGTGENGFGDARANPIDMSSSSAQTVAGLTAACNYSGSNALVTVSSSQNFALTSGSESVDYTLDINNNSFTNENFDRAAGTYTFNFVPPAPNDTQTSALKMTLNGTGSVAGTYTDTLTVSIDVQ
jgi:hypothetical protein